MFNPIDKNKTFPELERDIIRFWRDHRIFRKTLDRTRGMKEFVFYDGPPFATGLPHYGHLLASTIKDIVPRYQTMRNRYVERRFGWDCHGLPVEYEMEKELDLDGRQDIEAYGIDRFNESCRGIVLRYTKEWESTIERLGRWVDFENDYKTMTPWYMESIWWVFKQLWDKSLIYNGHKIMWYCPRCATPLSNFEVNQGYIEVEDPAVTLRFRALDRDSTYFLAWTTTPWTLPANLALTVGPDITYIEVDDDGTRYILAEDLLETYYPKEKPAVVKRVPGRDLVGMTYEPLFSDFAHKREEGAFRVISADFVSTEEGTGIVHTAPGFGEDDAAAAAANGIPVVCPLDDEGRYTAEVADYAGRFVKDCDKEIIKRLKTEGKLVHRSTHKHNYPHCWRCDAPLLNKAISTWFVKVTEIKERMMANNRQIHWVPRHLRDGRFGKWLENARDWAISRSRFWGTPLPVWHCECGQTVCVGSMAELQTLTGEKVDDLHKHFVDRLTAPCPECGQTMRRIPEVLDCWFESGSMPYAQIHYPFENKDWFEHHFPADFIAEGLDQTRGWFYTLVVLSTALFDRPAFQNVIVNGILLAEDGGKMSKRKKNYTAPDVIFERFGADAVRLYMMNSAAVRAEDLRFSDKGVEETVRSILLPLWNAVNFFVTYANIDGWEDTTGQNVLLNHKLDRWILSVLNHMIEDVTAAMDGYELQKAVPPINAFLDNLTNWYIRRSRRRFWDSGSPQDQGDAYYTLYTVLMAFSKTLAPYAPFITESVYRILRRDGDPESVHLCEFPETATSRRDPALEEQMSLTQRVVSMGRSLRTAHNLKIRQPLSSVTVVTPDRHVHDTLSEVEGIIRDELNIKTVEYTADESELVTFSAKANFKVLGPKYGRIMKPIAAAVGQLGSADISSILGGTPHTLNIDGETVPLSADDIIVQRHEKEGVVVENAGSLTVAINTDITPELASEGIAREFINRVQNMRKTADLNVTDRIIIAYTGDETVCQAVDTHRQYICDETLADRIESGTDSGTAWTIMNQTVSIQVNVV